MLIYFAHPIDQTANSPHAQILKTAIAHLEEAAQAQGHWMYRPGGAFKAPVASPWTTDDMGHVDLINRQALFEADAVLALIVPGMPTLGVPSEIEQAILLNRPVCIVTTERLRQSSIQLANWVGQGARYVFMSPSGVIRQPNLAELLGSLPDPTRSIDGTILAENPALLVKAIHPHAKTLTRAYRGDAGLDLAVVGDHEIHPGEYKVLPTGVAAAVPDGFWGMLAGRSSTWIQWRFDIRTAIIDSGYRGELMIGVHNRGSERKTVPHGARLAQYVLLPAFMGDIHEVDELPAHERGHNGYGSSGQ